MNWIDFDEMNRRNNVSVSDGRDNPAENSKAQKFVVRKYEICLNKRSVLVTTVDIRPGLLFSFFICVLTCCIFFSCSLTTVEICPTNLQQCIFMYCLRSNKIGGAGNKKVNK